MNREKKQAEKAANDSSYAKAELWNSAVWADTDESAMDRLNEADLAHCVLVATIYGRERLVRDLVQRRGPVPIVITRHDDGEHDFRLNGQQVHHNFRYFGKQVNSPAALKSLLAMITEYGMKGLIEPGPSFPLLWHRLDENQQRSKIKALPFEGELPALLGGVLGQPELAVALHEESARTGMPEAYKPVLCWASEEMIRHFPQGLAPLRGVQEVEGHGTLSEWKAKSGTPESLEYGAVVVGVRPSERCTELAGFLCRDMSPTSARLGLEDNQGRVLCETTSDFLLSFPMSDCSEDNLVLATEFVKNYCPIEIMALQAAAICTRDFGHAPTTYFFRNEFITKMSEQFNPLFEALWDDERVQDLMTKDQWALLLKNAEFINAKSLLALYEVLGIDNSGASVTLDADDLLLLAEGGYRFADGTRAFEKDLDIRAHNRIRDLAVTPSVRIPERLSFVDPSVVGRIPSSAMLEYVLSVYKRIDKMNLWPIQDVRPIDLPHVLKMSARLDIDHIGNNKSMALHARMLNAGVEACAVAASSPTQWLKLTEVFTPEELKPFVKVMPAKAKGRLLEMGLGL